MLVVIPATPQLASSPSQPLPLSSPHQFLQAMHLTTSADLRDVQPTRPDLAVVELKYKELTNPEELGKSGAFMNPELNQKSFFFAGNAASKSDAEKQGNCFCLITGECD